MDRSWINHSAMLMNSAKKSLVYLSWKKIPSNKYIINAKSA